MSDATVTCVFCGQQYPPGTPNSQHSALYAHIQNCQHHPLWLALNALRYISNPLSKLAPWQVAEDTVKQIEQALNGVTQ
jgi:hypothetical protein